MPYPSQYSEPQLASYMLSESVLGATATLLGWTEDHLIDAVWDAIAAYGVDTIAEATDIQKLRALARVEAWRQACAALAARYDVQDGDQRLNRSQMLKAAQANLAEAETQAASLGVGPGVVHVDIVRQPDPFAYWPDEVLETFVR